MRAEAYQNFQQHPELFQGFTPTQPGMGGPAPVPAGTPRQPGEPSIAGMKQAAGEMGGPGPQEPPAPAPEEPMGFAEARQARAAESISNVRPGQMPDWQAFADALDVGDEPPLDTRADPQAVRAVQHPIRKVYELFTNPPEPLDSERGLALIQTTYGRSIVNKLTQEQKVNLYRLMKRAGTDALLTEPMNSEKVRRILGR